MLMLVLVHISLVAMAFYLQHLTGEAAAGNGLVGGPGFRTPSTTASPEAWQRAHAAAYPIVNSNVIAQLALNSAALILEAVGAHPIVTVNFPVALMIPMLGYATWKADHAAKRAPSL